MLILATFAAIALLTAGMFAVAKGDTAAITGLLVVLILVVLVIAPYLVSVLHHVHEQMNAALPLALHSSAAFNQSLLPAA